ncbi:MAG: tRNA dihydrouridine synthase DusB [Bacillota bacterium]|nr:tRNA dihydrouridine synthase DusB [Bacillota bacterium]
MAETARPGRDPEAWELGGVRIRSRVVLGPMAGATDLPFRLLAWEMGIGLAYTEMISAMALVHRNTRTRELLRRDPAEGPVSVQLFGREPEILARAAELVLAEGETAPDGGAAGRPAAIDLNAGCPTPKIVKNGEGAALMRQPELLEEIVRALVRVAGPRGVPVTVKLRAGWDGAHRNAVEVARVAEAAGAALVAVHGRTRDQFYSGRADWSVIREVREAVQIAVIGNGDVAAPEDALAMRETTGCDAVMIARGALGNPWLLRRAVEALAGRPVPPPPTPGERLAFLLRHLRMQVAYLGEEYGVREMRKHVAWYLKGLPGAGPVKRRVHAAVTLEEVTGILQDYASSVAVAAHSW